MASITVLCRVPARLSCVEGGKREVMYENTWRGVAGCFGGDDVGERGSYVRWG